MAFQDTGGIAPNTFEHKTLQSGEDSTSEVESNEVNVAGAKKITFIFKRANHSSGSTDFQVKVSLDGTNFVQYNKLIKNTTNTNSQQLTREGTVTLSSNTSELYSVDVHDAFLALKTSVKNDTDGDGTVDILIEY